MGASRLTFRLSGDVSFSGASGQDSEEGPKSSLSAAGQVMASEEGDLRAERTQDTLPHLNNIDASGLKLATRARTCSTANAGPQHSDLEFAPNCYKGRSGFWTRI